MNHNYFYICASISIRTKIFKFSLRFFVHIFQLRRSCETKWTIEKMSHFSILILLFGIFSFIKSDLMVREFFGFHFFQVIKVPKWANNQKPSLFKFDRVSKEGIEIERYNVTTDDGYILGLYHLVQKTAAAANSSSTDTFRPILFMHGLVSSSQDYVMFMNVSPGCVLNSKSTKHVKRIKKGISFHRVLFL